MTNAWLFFSSFFCALLVSNSDTAVKMIENTNPIIPIVSNKSYPDAPISLTLLISELNTPVSPGFSCINPHSLELVAVKSIIPELLTDAISRSTAHNIFKCTPPSLYEFCINHMCLSAIII